MEVNMLLWMLWKLEPRGDIDINPSHISNADSIKSLSVRVGQTCDKG